MTQAQPGQTVRAHYKGKFEDGTVFDSSEGREPLEFTLGARQVIPGFEQAIEGMEPGQRKTEKIPAEKAYGPRRDDLLLAVPRTQFPAHIEPKVGQELQIQTPQGQPAPVRVVDVAQDKVTLDANHPLAGRDLVFDIQLVEIVPAAGK